MQTALKAYGTTHNFTYVAGTQYVHNFDKLLFMPSDLTLGAEYNHDGMKDVIVGYDRRFKQHVDIGSFFFQNEWKNRQWSFLLGGRLDKHNLVDHVIFSPRANLRYNPTENVNLRFTYAGGFRAPQAFDEDMHVGVVGGERLVTILADNLKEERSNSFSLSADLYHKFGSVQTNLLIEGFYTDLDNVFGGCAYAALYGAEHEAGLRHPRLQVSHAIAQRRHTEHHQCLSERLRQGLEPRLGLHLRPVAAQKLLRWREAVLLINSRQRSLPLRGNLILAMR